MEQTEGYRETQEHGVREREREREIQRESGGKIDRERERMST